MAVSPQVLTLFYCWLLDIKLHCGALSHSTRAELSFGAHLTDEALTLRKGSSVEKFTNSESVIGDVWATECEVDEFERGGGSAGVRSGGE